MGNSSLNTTSDKTLKEKIISLAYEKGVDKVRFTSRERLRDAPPSGHLDFILPSVQSTISFAIALDKPAIRAYLGKKDWMTHVNDFKESYRGLKAAGMAISELFEDSGHEVAFPHINFACRQD